jgi:hypothetical protein
MSKESLFQEDELSVINDSQKIRKEILTSLVTKGYSDEDNVKTILTVLKDMDSSVYTKVRLKTLDKSSDALKDMAANSANILLRLRDVIAEEVVEETTTPVLPNEVDFNRVPDIDKIGEINQNFNEFMAKMEN